MTIVKPREISLWKLGAALLPVIAAVGVPAVLHPVHHGALTASVVCSTTAFAITIYAIPKLGPSFIKVGLKGRDLLKKSTDDVSVNNPHSLHASNASSIGQNAWASSVHAYTYVSSSCSFRSHFPRQSSPIPLSRQSILSIQLIVK